MKKTEVKEVKLIAPKSSKVSQLHEGGFLQVNQVQVALLPKPKNFQIHALDSIDVKKPTNPGLVVP